MISYGDVVEKIIRSGRYPALFFLFSRRLVEEHAINIAKKFDFIEKDTKLQIKDYLSRNLPLQAQSLHKSLVQCLEAGVGYHHAGLLPSAKKAVEDLFVAGCLPVVMCTETFALGVNYPARTVVIGQTSKRDDNGFRPLTDREILQMGGRAGRRGQDRRGYVYICVDPDYPEDVPRRAPCVPEEVRPSGGYTPETVLRLVYGLGSDKNVLKEYVSKSFAAYVAGVAKEKARREYLDAEAELEQLNAQSGCQWHNGCVIAIRKRRKLLKGELKMYEHNIQQIKERLKLRKDKEKKYKRSLARCKEKIREIENRLRSLPEGVNCPHADGLNCSIMEKREELEKKISQLQSRYAALPDPAAVSWDAFENLATALVNTGFLSSDWTITEKGRFALDVGPGGVLYAEIIFRLLRKKKDKITEETLVEYAGGTVYRTEEFLNIAGDKNNVVKNAATFLWNNGIEVSYSSEGANALLKWWSGSKIEKASYAGMMAPGDFVVFSRRAAEVLRGACNSGIEEVSVKAKRAYKKVWRDEVADVF